MLLRCFIIRQVSLPIDLGMVITFRLGKEEEEEEEEGLLRAVVI